MFILAGLYFIGALVVGVVFKSTTILSTIGLTTTGPVAGGLFSLAQSDGCISILCSGLMAVAQSIVMTAI